MAVDTFCMGTYYIVTEYTFKYRVHFYYYFDNS